MGSSGLFANVTALLGSSGWRDLIDILLVWIVVYRVLILIRNTGTVQMLSGLGVMAVLFLLSSHFEFTTFHWILDKFFGNLFLIVVVLFQAEIRRALAHIGSNPFFSGHSQVEETHVAEEIAKSAVTLAQKGIGGLIVIEREINVDYFIELGTEMDARVSSELLVSLFLPQSPVHDGAVVIRDSRLLAAGCFLPLSKNPILDKNLGTRHRAAVGLTEETDAIVIVISEENLRVGVVEGGVLQADVDLSSLRRILYEALGIRFRAVQKGVL